MEEGKAGQGVTSKVRTRGRSLSSFPQDQVKSGCLLLGRYDLHHASSKPLCSWECCHPARGQADILQSLLLLQDLGAGPCSYHHPCDHSRCCCLSINPQFNGESCLEDNFSVTSDLMHEPPSTWGHNAHIVAFAFPERLGESRLCCFSCLGYPSQLMAVRLNTR